MPRPGERRTYPRDPLVFQHYAGHGMQLHPLASFGRANALTAACLRRRRALDRHARAEAERTARIRRTGERPVARRVALHGAPCRERRLTRMLDRLVALSSTRRGYRAWEYQFAYGGGAPLWVSGMAQATAVQALARGAVALRRPDWMRAAREALGAFEQAPPAGIRLAGGDGAAQYLMYSFAPGLQILNGHLQAVSGLHAMAELSGSRRARRLYRAGDRAARRVLAAYDTGAWSLYSRDGREATLGYHVLVRDLARTLCTGTGRRAYCAAGRRFGRYLTEPPGLRVRAPRRVRAGRLSSILLRLDRVSTVALRVGRAVPAAGTELERGRHVLVWRPARKGTARLVVDAVSRSGRRARRVLRVRVTPVPKPRRARDRERESAAEKRRRTRRREHEGRRPRVPPPPERPAREPSPSPTPVPAPAPDPLPPAPTAEPAPADPPAPSAAAPAPAPAPGGSSPG
jgi:hypothetical protein